MVGRTNVAERRRLWQSSLDKAEEKTQKTYGAQKDPSVSNDPDIVVATGGGKDLRLTFERRKGESPL
jgi:hypothetical protein